MSPNPHNEPSSVTYDSNAEGTVSFSMTFDKAVDLVEHATTRLWVRAKAHDDIELFCYLQELNATTSEVTPILVLGTNTYIETHGRIRMSLRSYRKPDTNNIYQYPNDVTRYLSKEDIISVDIPIWLTAVYYEAREKLTLLVQGWNSQKQPEFQSLEQLDTINKGRHTIHTRGRNDAVLKKDNDY